MEINASAPLDPYTTKPNALLAAILHVLEKLVRAVAAQMPMTFMKQVYMSISSLVTIQDISVHYI